MYIDPKKLRHLLRLAGKAARMQPDRDLKDIASDVLSMHNNAERHRVLSAIGELVPRVDETPEQKRSKKVSETRVILLANQMGFDAVKVNTDPSVSTMTVLADLDENDDGEEFEL